MKTTCRIATACVFIAGFFVAEAQSLAKRPNILFAISDDQSYPHASAYGCRGVRTPAFARGAKGGGGVPRGGGGGGGKEEEWKGWE